MPTPPPIQFRNQIIRQNKQILGGARKLPLASLKLWANLTPQSKVSAMMQQVYAGKP